MARAAFQFWSARLAPEPSAERQRAARRAWVSATLTTVAKEAEAMTAAAGRPPGPGARSWAGNWAGWTSCGDVVTLSFGNRPLAVNIEADRPVPDGMARRSGLDHGPFWRGWTRKEAVLKLLSAGLWIDPSRIALLPGEGAPLDGRRLPVCLASTVAPLDHIAPIAFQDDDRADDAGGH